MNGEKLLVLEGKDWSSLQLTQNKKSIPGDTEAAQEIAKCFESTPNTDPSPFNLGISYNKNKLNIKFNAPQYVGAMPIMCTDTFDTKGYAFVYSRFATLSVNKMVSEVLKGADYYENPDLFEVKTYSINEWKDICGKQVKQNEKTLFGIVNGLGEIDLDAAFSGKEGNLNNKNGIADSLGIFEIIDFVNKAKIACKKNLKKQSQKVEANLFGKVKGRILIQKQIKYNLSKNRVFNAYCSYNQLSDDIPENRIMKYALYLCKKHSALGEALAEDISFCMNMLSGVTLKKCTSSDFIGIKNNGAYRHYKDVMVAAKKVINRYFISHENSNAGENEKTKSEINSHKITPYFIDMNLLFELYCRAVVRKAIDKHKGGTEIEYELESAKLATRKLFEKAEMNTKGNYFKINDFYMNKYIPDIVIRYKHKDDKGALVDVGVAAILDAKYSSVKDASDKKRSRTHQILFYMQTTDCQYGGLMSPFEATEDFGEEDDSKASSNNIGKKLGNGCLYGDVKDIGKKLCYIAIDYKAESKAEYTPEDNVEILLRKLDEDLPGYIAEKKLNEKWEYIKEKLDKLSKKEQCKQLLESVDEPEEFAVTGNKDLMDLQKDTWTYIINYMWGDSVSNSKGTDNTNIVTDEEDG